MVSLFRKIRQKLLGQHRITQYLAYAVGEIFLVVIGILIALQINTWNELRKTRQYEIKMLKELKSTLEKDRNYFSSQIPRLSHKQEAANRLLAMIENKEENLDTLNKYFADLRFDILFQYNAGAYGSIKSGGIDKISNDSIRAKMADIYEFLIPRSEKIFENLSNLDPVESALVEQLTTRVIVPLENGEKTIRGRMIDPKVIYREEFLHLIQLHKNSTYTTKNRLESLLPPIEDLILLIEEELNSTPA
ncbi:hypothetical protein D0X99_00415 [Algoriphagus lacus]|uniref:Uncharacterized protein n=1 Tax=Algoriphagus lacus TaxID=2056311 RepID=A0A418PVK5_9BACT|nr:DUF6090 family protein [Algoriphagus lacus]RIW18198.1 hypothetical protein D0X99_00415 [Algoriphagus lacus]